VSLSLDYLQCRVSGHSHEALLLLRRVTQTLLSGARIRLRRVAANVVIAAVLIYPAKAALGLFIFIKEFTFP